VSSSCLSRLSPHRSIGNYCFEGFATGDSEQDRGASHTHTALHHPSEDPTQRSPFLPNEVVKVGQLHRQRSQLIQCVALAMTSKEFAVDNRIDITLSLILLDMELSDIGTTAQEIWSLAEDSITGRAVAAVLTMSSEEEESKQGVQSVSVPLGDSTGGGSGGGPQLANALKQQNPHATRQILQAYRTELDINYVEPVDLLPLASLAILSKQKDVALLLIRRGADPTLRSRQGRSVLYLLIEAGYLDLLTIVLQKHPHLDINMIVTGEGNSYTMLHTAVRFHHGHIVQFLAEWPGVNLNPLEAEYQYTPFMLAVLENCQWTIDVLLRAGVDITIPARNGRTPLYLAVEKSQLSTFQTLLTVQTTSHQGPNINASVCISHGSAPLHVAVLHNKLEMVEYLLRSGAEVDREDHHGCTPFFRALLHGHETIALELLKAGANPLRSSATGRSYFYVALEKGLVEVVRVLLTHHHLPINSPTSSETVDSLPLSVSLIYRNRDTLRLLVEQGADVNLTETLNGNSPLMTAIFLEDYWAVSFLLQHGADPSRPNLVGRQPLYVAAEKGSVEVIRLLLTDSRVSVNGSVSDRGETPLHVAITWRQADAISTLLCLGADELAIDNQGRTPLDLVQEVAQSTSSSLLQIFLYYRTRSRRAGQGP
jgi:ankyrin repeat protein